MLCIFGFISRLQGEVASEKSGAENAVEFDHFALLIQGTFSVSSSAKRNELEQGVEEAREAFTLKPEPLNALWFANLLMNMDRVPEALEVLLRTIQIVASRTTKSSEDSAQIICALYNNAGTLS